MSPILPFRHLGCVVVLLALGFARGTPAQWSTQTVTLRPGWNAVYLHVDASHTNLDGLISGPANPIAEVWLWQPPASTLQFTVTPQQPTAPNSQWAYWDRSPVVVDTLSRLPGNHAYLVRNTNTTDYVWNVTGKPVPPDYQWTSDGLNFLGFPTPAGAPMTFERFLAPVPAFQHAAEIYRYPGGELGPTNPERVFSDMFRGALVQRGEAFWIRSGTLYNRYFGPVEIVLPNTSGVHFGDNLGVTSVRLRNLTGSARTMTLDLMTSGTPPDGQVAPIGDPPLLVRGALNITNLTHSHTVLDHRHSFTLTPQGQDGSEIEVVLGLNRALMTAPPGSEYAAILRFADTEGFSQVDLPVTATVAEASGLWVGGAAIDRVGQYLKTYASATSVADAAAQVETMNLPTEFRTWVARPPSPVNWEAVASSADGSRLVAAGLAGRIHTSADAGTNWIARESNRDWTSVASSADGSRLVAVAKKGQIHTSNDAGTNWVARESTRNWSAVASSADGMRLVAADNAGSVYTSVNAGTNWTRRDSVRNWSAVASSADGTRLAAVVNPGRIFLSSDSGATWSTNANTQPWTSIAMSADGTQVIAAASNSRIHTSDDAGANWTEREEARPWQSVAMSADGTRLAAVELPGRVYTSTDSGERWTAWENSRIWTSIASSADASRLVATVYGGAIHTSTGTFQTYPYDPESGRILVSGSEGNLPYLATGTNTALAEVPRPFPLRLILHQDAAGISTLLQRVYIGKDRDTNATALATQESLLDPSALESARRISASHLPFSHTNLSWRSLGGAMRPGLTLTFTVELRHDDHASNPFLHTFIPTMTVWERTSKPSWPRVSSPTG